MTQTDDKNPVGLSHFIQFILRFGSLSFFLWWTLLALLSPLWGSMLWDLSDHIVAKAGFLESKGVLTHPSTELFKDIGWSKVLGVGALLGFLFYGLPIALALGFIEALASSISNKKLAWLVRLLGLSWYFTDLGQALSVYSSHAVWGFFVACFCLLWAYGLARFFDKLASKAVLGSWKKSLLVWLAMLLCVSHFLTHPVLKIAVDSESFKETDPMTLVRDWLLLDENGNHWVNSWYYGHSPLIMEKQMVTSFQPMVIALVDVNEAYWKNRLLSYFARRKGERVQRAFVIHLKADDDIEELLEKRWVDFVAIGDQHIDVWKDRVSTWEKGCFAFLQSDVKDYQIRHEAHYNFERWGYVYKRTPVITRRDTLQDQGFDDRESKVMLHHKLGLGSVLGNPKAIVFLLVLILSGALTVLYFVMASVSRIRPILLLLFPLAMSPYWVSGVIHNIKFWLAAPESSELMEYKVLRYHRHTRAKDPSLYKKVLSEELSADSRVGMWQVVYLGVSYQQLKSKEAKLEIVKWLEKVVADYENRPFSFRYKIIEAASLVPELIAAIDNACLTEKHPYVRWYAEDSGLGLRQ